MITWLFFFAGAFIIVAVPMLTLYYADMLGDWAGYLLFIAFGLFALLGLRGVWIRNESLPDFIPPPHRLRPPVYEILEDEELE